MKIYKIAQQNIQISHSALISQLSSNNEKNLANFIYSAITTNPNWQNLSKSLNPKTKQDYLNITNTATKSNPAWAQWDVQKGLPQSTNDYKTYFTTKDEDISKVIQGIQQLAQYLKPISDKYKMNLDYKIPSTSTGYFGANDKLVVHFSNQSANQEVQTTVQQWAKAYNISFANRTHSQGQDDKTSWGQRVANHLAQLALQHLNSKKYTPDQIAKWIEQYLSSSLAQLSKST